MEIRHQQQKDRSDGEQKSGAQARDRFLQCGYLSAHSNRRALWSCRQILQYSVDSFLSFAERHPVQVCSDADDPLSAKSFDHLGHRPVFQFGNLI